MRRTVMEAEHEAFRSAFRDFASKEIVPFHGEWEQAGIVPRTLWEKAGAAGFLCLNVPEEYGGGGSTDYRFLAVISEELARSGASGVGFPMHTDIVAPYLLGYGSLREYPVARAFTDARVQSIYAGTNEIMKEIIGRALTA